MKIRAAGERPERINADVLVLPLFKDGPPAAGVEQVDRALGGVIDDMFSAGEFKASEGEEQLIPVTRKVAARRVLLIGLGSRDALTAASLTRYVGAAVRSSARRRLGDVAILLPDRLTMKQSEAAEAAAVGALMADFDPAPYRSDAQAKAVAPKSVTLVTAASADAGQIKRGIERGAILGEAANRAREMVNTPANEMTPTHLAERAQGVAKKHRLKVRILDRPDIKRLKMDSFLSVAAGSDEPPKIIVLEYRGAPGSKTVLGLVGKGITFDTGGISLKPALDMDAMKGDMAGGATVIAAMEAIGALKPRVNVIGVVCATENMPSGKATKPGDVVRAANGKTIEIINTDAEGRLVLADGLWYARQLGATHLIDIATLTGAAVVALGTTTTGVMSNDRELADLFHEAAVSSGERYWELPLFPEYADLIRSSIADMKNSGGRPAGTIYGAMFLKEFVDQTPWIHLDIAGTAWTDKDHGHLTKGPTGVAMRPLVRLAELLAERTMHGRADEAAVRRFINGQTSATPGAARRAGSIASPNGAPKARTKSKRRVRR